MPNTDDERITFRVDLEHMQYFGAESMRWIVTELQLQVVHLESLGHPNVAPVVTGSTSKRLLRDLVKRLPGFRFVNRVRMIYSEWQNSAPWELSHVCIFRRIF